MKIQINFEIKKKKSNLYLMKMQISFEIRKKIKSIFNENTNQFCDQKKNRSVFNENTYQFCDQKKNQICKYRSVLSLEKKKSYLKIQISFEFREKKIRSENIDQF